MLRIFIFLFFLLAGSKSYSQTINIISWNNGVGLTNDFKILQEALTQLGHTVNYVSSRYPESAPKADVNIIIEYFDSALLSSADKNYFIPNAEYCDATEDEIKKFDLILCRTKEAERIFHPINPNTFYLGFTSLDRKKQGVKKNFNHLLHLKGMSGTKGTDKVIGLWTRKPKFPKLTLLDGRAGKNPKLENLEYKRRYLSEESLVDLQNRCGIHLCPSQTEGFGHYISEAMSTGAVVVTTNAPPMNEFVTDPRCLVKYKKTGSQRYATNYYVQRKDLGNVIENLMKLPKKELRKIGRENRRRYLENKRAFLERLKVLFSN